MKNFRRSLPPLDYLLFFEAAARHGNFTRAAEELNVSQAAVSKRVKVLEDWLGMTLVHRSGRKLSLSRNGKALADNTSEALDYLNSALQQMRKATTGQRLSLAANVAVAQYWLTPRINEYLLSANAVPVTLTASDKDADLFALDVDAIIYYGSNIPSGWEGAPLFEEIWLPVVAPSLLVSWESIDQATLLDFDKLTPKWINWDNFAALTGNEEFAAAPKVNLRSYGSTLDTALRGKGLALGCPEVLQFEIDGGRLATLDDFGLRTGRSYFAIWRGGSMSADIRALLDKIGVYV